MKKLQKADVLKINEMTKEEFLTFFDKYFDYQGCEEGFWVDFKETDNGFTVWFTNMDILQAMKDSGAYNELVDEYGEDALKSYEDQLYKANCDLYRNNSYYPSIKGEKEEEIAEDVLKYYDAHEYDLDEDALYNARDYIQEKALEMIEENEEA